MRKFRNLFLILPLILLSVSACMRVEPGYVGIKVKLTGTEQGVNDIPVVTGRVWYNPWTTEIYPFPTFMQTAQWTADSREGSVDNQEITFNSLEGTILKADVGVSFSFEREKVPALYVEFRKSAQEILDTYMRNRVRDAFNQVAGTMNAVTIFGEGKQALLDSVQAQLVSELGERGFQIDQVSMIGAPRGPESVQSSIDAVIQAKQQAIEAENRVRQAEAEAQQAVAAAEGRAESQLIEARAEAEANRIVAASISDRLVRWESIRKWNGILPTVTGGSIPMVNIPTGGGN
jgi:regulator of protease activity HflC (stomatin/prohibitin superfamily)